MAVTIKDIKVGMTFHDKGRNHTKSVTQILKDDPNSNGAPYTIVAVDEVTGVTSCYLVQSETQDLSERLVFGNPTRPMLIFEYVCGNKCIGTADNVATIQRPTPPSRIRKIASDPVNEGDWVRNVARDLCPFNQIQRVTCRVKGYLYAAGKRADEGETKTLYEGMTLV